MSPLSRAITAPDAARGKLFKVIVIGTLWPPTISGALMLVSETTGAGLRLSLR